MNMKLSEFSSNFAKDAKMRIVEKEKVLYEGDAETLNKLLTGYVYKRSGKLVDGTFQVEVTEYQF